MKVAAAVLMIGFSVSIFAQGPDKEMKSPEEKAEHITKKMTDKLHLSEEQSSQLYDINLQSIKEHEVMREEIKMHRDKIKAQKKALREKTESEIISILTDEQKAEFEKMKAEREAKMKERRE